MALGRSQTAIGGRPRFHSGSGPRLTSPDVGGPEPRWAPELRHLATVVDPAVAHVHDPAGAGGHLVAVGDHQDRLALAVQAPEQLEDLTAAVGVERAGGLVGQQQRGLVGQGPGDGQALALTAGQHGRHLVGLVPQAEQVEQVSSLRLGRLAPACRR